jgi:endonuclease/exonuclease/phosphatase (EEP) superfamily protein YafD
MRRLVLGLLVVLLLPAVLLSWDRLAAPTGGWWVRLVAFTPFAIPLYGLALLVLAVCGWRSAGRWRAAARVGAVVAALGLALHLVWASGPYVGTATASAAGDTLRVMTVNLRVGHADPARVVATAVDHRVDVLVMEEVTPGALAGMRAAGLAEAFPHRVGRARSGGKGTLVLSRLPVSGARPLDTGFGGYRMDLHAGDGLLVGLVAVHVRPPTGDARGWAADLNAVRSAAVAEDGPTMVVGDFNATDDHLPMRELRGRGFDDAAVQARSGWQPTWPSADEVSVLTVPVPSLLPIDHVLVNRGLRALRTESVTVPGTDHRALVAILGT